MHPTARFKIWRERIEQTGADQLRCFWEHAALFDLQRRPARLSRVESLIQNFRCENNN